MARKYRQKRLVVKHVIHSMSEWTKKWKKNGKKKIGGTQQIDRCWNWMKRWLPPQMKNRTKVSVNGRFWDRVYQNGCTGTTSALEEEKKFRRTCLQLPIVKMLKKHSVF